MSGGGRLAGSEWRLGDAWLVIAISINYREERGETSTRAAIAEFYLFRIYLAPSPPPPHTSHAHASSSTKVPYQARRFTGFAAAAADVKPSVSRSLGQKL